MPIPTIDELYKIFKYIGENTLTYISGNYYQCVNDGNTYYWRDITDKLTNTNNFPSPSENTVNKLINYNGIINSEQINLISGNHYVMSDLSGHNWINYTKLLGDTTEYPKKRTLPERLVNRTSTIFQYIGNTISADICYYYNYNDMSYQSLVTDGSIYNFPTTNKLQTSFISLYTNDKQFVNNIYTCINFDIENSYRK